jgi:hypothetical protein
MWYFIILTGAIAVGFLVFGKLQRLNVEADQEDEPWLK